MKLKHKKKESITYLQPASHQTSVTANRILQQEQGLCQNTRAEDGLGILIIYLPENQACTRHKVIAE